jgi:ribosomal protein S1
LEREVIAASFEALLERLAKDPDWEAWTYANVADEVARASRQERPDLLLPLPTGGGLKKGQVVTAIVAAWTSGQGIDLTYEGQRLNVFLDEISWLGYIHQPDERIAKPGAPLTVKLLKYDAADHVWRASLRALHRDQDPLRLAPAAFAIGTVHEASVSYVEPFGLGFALLPSGLHAQMDKGMDDHLDVEKGARLQVEITAVYPKDRLIKVRLAPAAVAQRTS